MPKGYRSKETYIVNNNKGSSRVDDSKFILFSLPSQIQKCQVAYLRSSKAGIENSADIDVVLNETETFKFSFYP